MPAEKEERKEEYIFIKVLFHGFYSSCKINIEMNQDSLYYLAYQG